MIIEIWYKEISDNKNISKQLNESDNYNATSLSENPILTILSDFISSNQQTKCLIFTDKTPLSCDYNKSDIKKQKSSNISVSQSLNINECIDLLKWKYIYCIFYNSSNNHFFFDVVSTEKELKVQLWKNKEILLEKLKEDASLAFSSIISIFCDCESGTLNSTILENVKLTSVPNPLKRSIHCEKYFQNKFYSDGFLHFSKFKTENEFANCIQLLLNKNYFLDKESPEETEQLQPSEQIVEGGGGGENIFIIIIFLSNNNNNHHSY
jgi:hypothetical protein